MPLRTAGSVAVVLVASVATSAVFAANPGKEQIKLTKAGQAQAKAEVLRRRDVGKGWRGGTKKPDLSSAFPGCSYHPKQSDLVLNGVTETTWQKQGTEIDSEAQVLKTAAMVRLDWQRTVLAPQVMPCLRKSLAKSVGTAGTIVSFGKVAFPNLATFARGYRALVEVNSALGKVRVEVDLAVFGARRNELTLSVTGLAAAMTSLRRTELRLARLLVTRVK